MNAMKKNLGTRITVLIDNKASGSLVCEWGLSILIEEGSRKILLDTGSSNLFLKNAKELGIDISSVDMAVLSHAHYDHSGGFEGFFKENKNAKLYLSKNVSENCYKLKNVYHRYIGIPKGLRFGFEDRLVYVDGLQKIANNVYVLDHSTKNMDSIGERNKMYQKYKRKYIADNFNHEVSVIVKKKDGLIILNSCSHGGPKIIMNEAKRAFPDEKIICYIGGLHLFDKTEKEILDVAKVFKKEGIQLYTGHCTGDKAYALLEQKLKDQVHLIESGLTLQLK